MHGIDIARVPTTIATRWASPENTGAIAGGGGQANGGRKGSGNFSLDDGESRILASISGSSGTVRRIWITMWSLAGKDQETEARCLRGMRLRCWWDGAQTPAVDVPLGDFFCQGLGRMSAAFENEYFANPEGRSLVCFLPMPFRTGMRIELTNQTGCHQQWIFYDVDMTLGDRHEPDTCYLHAHWRREQRTTLGRDFELLPEVAGRGRFLGACISVIPDRSVYGRSWWGEGEAKMYLDDDDDHPTLCGTGTEDYIATGWGQGRFAQRWHGCPIADEQRYSYAFYRLHGPDPVYFQRRIRVAMQQIGNYSTEHLPLIRARGVPFRDLFGRAIDLEKPLPPDLNGLYDRQGDDWASCAWFYLDRPDGVLPPLVPPGDRLAALAT